MQSADAVFAGSIPALYDRHLGPALFEPYAVDLAGRLTGLTAGSLLEIASGTGRVTRALARTLAPAVTITATDLNQAMVDFAMAQPIARPVTWRQADALALPFADDSFDVVLCQFGVMFFPDKIAGYRQARRVLKPDGCLIFNVWDRIEANDFSKVTTDGLGLVFPADPPLFLPRTPYAYYSIDTIESDLHTAGFRSAAVETAERTSQLPAARDLAIGFCQGSPLRNEIEARSPGGLEAVTDAVAETIASHLGAGAITGKMRAHVITAAP
jgi:SAM-dependent methyltransferase